MRSSGTKSSPSGWVATSGRPALSAQLTTVAAEAWHVTSIHFWAPRATEWATASGVPGLSTTCSACTAKASHERTTAAPLWGS